MTEDEDGFVRWGDTPCLAGDSHNLDGRESFILCHKPKGHEGDHGNERFSWPRLSDFGVEAKEQQ